MSSLRQIEKAVEGGSEQGSLNGTTSVEIVATPAAGFTRVVERISFVNVDTATVDIRARVLNSAVHTEFDNSLTLAVDGKFRPVDSASELRLVVGDSLTAVMGGAAATTNPTWVACWRDEPDPT